MTVANTAVSVAGPGALLGTVLEEVGVPGIALTAVAVCSGTEKEKVGGATSVLTSGTAVVAAAASAAGAMWLALELGLLTAGWTRAGSLFPESGVG